jgi:hypothetical protein
MALRLMTPHLRLFATADALVRRDGRRAEPRRTLAQLLVRRKQIVARRAITRDTRTALIQE